VSIHRDDDPLPEPNVGMSPEEKGKLLLAYIQRREPLAPYRQTDEGFDRIQHDFSRAVLRGVSLVAADLLDANLTEASLQGSDLNFAILDQVCLKDADCSGASFIKARFLSAYMPGVNLRGCDLTEADLRGAFLEGADLAGATLRGALIDARAFQSMGLAPGELAARGVSIVDLASFPGEAQALLHGAVGLTLTFDSRLHPFDPAAFTLLVADVLGVGHDVTVVERSEAVHEPPAWIRINGCRAEDLLAVAEAFYDRVWRSAEAVAEERALQKAMSSGVALLVGRLDDLRDHLVKVEANTALLADGDVREAIVDRATEHVRTNRKKEFQTPLQRVISAVAAEVKRRTLDVVVGEGVADTAIEIAGEVVGDARRAIDDARVARFERKLRATDENPDRGGEP
jgi:hypothetical protein